MFKNRECVTQAVESAAVGIAVGILVHKILSPRSSQKPSSIAGYGYKQEQSQANSLQVPSHCNKHRKHRHSSRSKSASRAKQVEKEIDQLSVLSPSLKKSKLRGSERDLGSTSQTDNDKSMWCHYEKLEPRKNSVNSARHNNNLNTCDFDRNSSKPSNLKDSHCSIEKDHNLDFFGKAAASKSTKDIRFQLKQQKDLCDTTEDCELKCYRESLRIESTEYLPLKLEKQKNVCSKVKDYKMNNYRESFASTSTEYVALKLKDEKDY